MPRLRSGTTTTTNNGNVTTNNSGCSSGTNVGTGTTGGCRSLGGNVGAGGRCNTTTPQVSASATGCNCPGVGTPGPEEQHNCNPCLLHCKLCPTNGVCPNCSINCGISGTTGQYAHKQGKNTSASGYASHAQGAGVCNIEEFLETLIEEPDISKRTGPVVNNAAGIASHVEGGGNTACGNYAHAEGAGTQATGVASHSEGINTKSSGKASHAGGIGTIASTEALRAIGTYNLAGSGPNTFTTVGPFSFVVGTGTGSENRDDSFWSDYNGNVFMRNLTFGSPQLIIFSGESTNGSTVLLENNGNSWGVPVVNDFLLTNIGVLILTTVNGAFSATYQLTLTTGNTLNDAPTIYTFTLDGTGPTEEVTCIEVSPPLYIPSCNILLMKISGTFTGALETKVNLKVRDTNLEIYNKYYS